MSLFILLKLIHVLAAITALGANLTYPGLATPCRRRPRPARVRRRRETLKGSMRCPRDTGRSTLDDRSQEDIR